MAITLILGVLCHFCVDVEAKSGLSSPPINTNKLKAINRIKTIPVPNQSLKLSIKDIHLKGCEISVTLENSGSVALPNRYYKTARLIIEIENAKTINNKATLNLTKTQTFSFPLYRVDPSKYLEKPTGKVVFNTKIKCTSRSHVKAKLEGLGPKKPKELKLTLTPPLPCQRNSKLGKNVVTSQVLAKSKTPKTSRFLHKAALLSSQQNTGTGYREATWRSPQHPS